MKNSWLWLSLMFVVGVDTSELLANHNTVAGDYHACVWSGLGGSDIYCWGQNADQARTPKNVAEVASIQAGTANTCALLRYSNESIKRIVCWGNTFHSGNKWSDAATSSDLNWGEAEFLATGQMNNCGIFKAKDVSKQYKVLRCWGTDTPGVVRKDAQGVPLEEHYQGLHSVYVGDFMRCVRFNGGKSLECRGRGFPIVQGLTEHNPQSDILKEADPAILPFKCEFETKVPNKLRCSTEKPAEQNKFIQASCRARSKNFACKQNLGMEISCAYSAEQCFTNHAADPSTFAEWQIMDGSAGASEFAVGQGFVCWSGNGPVTCRAHNNRVKEERYHLAKEVDPAILNKNLFVDLPRLTDSGQVFDFARSLRSFVYNFDRDFLMLFESSLQASLEDATNQEDKKRNIELAAEMLRAFALALDYQPLRKYREHIVSMPAPMQKPNYSEQQFYLAASLLHDSLSTSRRLISKEQMATFQNLTTRLDDIVFRKQRVPLTNEEVAQLMEMTSGSTYLAPRKGVLATLLNVLKQR